VAIFGLLGALAVRGVQSKEPGNQVSLVLEFLNIQSQSFQAQAAILGVLAAVLLVGRTIMSIILVRRIFKFLSRRAASISSELVSRLLTRPLTYLQKRSTQETIYAAGYGVTSIALGVVGTAISITADTFLLLIMVIGLFIIDSTIAIATLFFFGFIGWLMYWLMNVRAKELGIRNWELSVQADERIAEALNSYRELLTSNRREYYSRQISQSRTSLAEILAEIQFLPNVSKYVIESSVILSALLIGATQFLLNDATRAAATLAVFLAAGTRVAPAVLRIQQGSIQIRNSLGLATPTLDLLVQLKGSPVLQPTEDSLDVFHEGFVGVVKVSNVTLKYEDSEKMALSGIDLNISEGKIYAVATLILC
jgi:ATP-binding cassette subfamily C protein